MPSRRRHRGSDPLPDSHSGLSGTSAAGEQSDGRNQGRKPHNRQGIFKRFSYIWVLILVAFLGVFKYSGNGGRHLAVTPMPLPRLTSLSQFGGTYMWQMLWGTYRPGLYLGIRMRLPSSLLAGLMWLDPQGRDPLSTLRHEAQQHDGLQRYGWHRHDGRSFGAQEIIDGQFNITTTFVKRFCRGCGGGGDWTLRVTARRTEGAPHPGANHTTPSPQISLLFYLADEQVDRPNMLVHPTAESADRKVLPLAEGFAPGAGQWALHGARERGQAAKQELTALQLHTQHFHNLTRLIQRHLSGGNTAREHLRLKKLPGEAPPPQPNLGVWQLSGELPLSIDFVFLGGAMEAEDSSRIAVAWSKIATVWSGGVAALLPPWSRDANLPADDSSDDSSVHGGAGHGDRGLRTVELSGAKLDAVIQRRSATFDKKFARTFPHLYRAAQPPGLGDLTEIAKRALSNMVGSLGYFYGCPVIGLPDSDSSTGWNNQQGPAAALFTGVPSRSFFPRGFLWDEGFHQLLVQRWDPLISRDVLGHWLDSMAATGWIPREQILGAEAEARVPSEFISQKATTANPPTLFLAFDAMARSAEAAAAAALKSSKPLTIEQHAEHSFLKAALPRLQAWFDWFQSTQHGELPGAYRWRGREVNDHELNPKTLTSGLDDAPRGSHPSHHERHVDLRCWMALAAGSLSTVASVVGAPKQQVVSAAGVAARLGDLDGLKALHYDPTLQQFLDYGLHSENATLQWALEVDSSGQPVRRVLRRFVTAAPTLRLVPQFGYISLFPLLLRQLPADCPELGAALEQLLDPQLLWTPFGLRSLARTATLYDAYNTEHDAPYWRGPIWFNANFLAIQALQHYSQGGGPYVQAAKEAHTKLRSALVGNVVKQYQKTGYLWENYDDKDGHGRGSHPFTGWTALLVLA